MNNESRSRSRLLETSGCCFARIVGKYCAALAAAACLACVVTSRPEPSVPEQADPFRNLLAPRLTPEFITGRSEVEGQLLAFVQEEIAPDPSVTRLVALIYLSEDPLEPLDRMLNPVRGEDAVDLPYFSRSSSSDEDQALVLVERANQHDSGGDMTASALITLRHSEEAGWIREEEGPRFESGDERTPRSDRAGGFPVDEPPPRGTGTTFPGHTDPLVAPSGLTRVIGRDSPSAHELLLVEGGNGPSRPIYSFPRSVEVAWSSDSRWLLVTDHRASDESSCVLLHVPSGLVTDILGEFRRSARYPWLGNHHTYMSCAAWLGEGGVLVKVVGYGDRDPAGFSRTYRYDAQRKTIREGDAVAFP